MIGYLHGNIIDCGESTLLVDVQGVGYLVYASTSTVSACLPGSSVKIFIHTVVREQNLDLYGFTEAKEKSLFELLITISGIGPKVALSILNATTPETLSHAVISKDSSVLTKVSGIGKKNAEKIILELENKIDASWSGPGESNSRDDFEVFEALEALGYRSRDIQESLRDPSVTAALSTQEKIRAIMKQLS